MADTIGFEDAVLTGGGSTIVELLREILSGQMRSGDAIYPPVEICALV